MKARPAAKPPSEKQPTAPSSKQQPQSDGHQRHLHDLLEDPEATLLQQRSRWEEWYLKLYAYKRLHAKVLRNACKDIKLKEGKKGEPKAETGACAMISLACLSTRSTGTGPDDSAMC